MTSSSTPLPYEERIAWFHQARFGMFIHFGLYSIPGRGEWLMFQERIPAKEYHSLTDQFTPADNCVDQWLDLAVDTGMKYAVLTTKHHDGFCLYDSQTTDFKTTATACGRDIVQEFVDGCRKRNLKAGLYISDLDWNYPGYFEPKKYPESHTALVNALHTQVEELLTNYGKIDMLWFDGSWIAHGEVKDIPEAEFWRAEELQKKIYELQPHILINNRLGIDGDLDTPEQHVTASQPGRGWESCMTIGDAQGWGWIKHSVNRKTVPQLLQNLAIAAAGEGNFLLNIGPRPDGSVDPEDTVRLNEMGKWMDVHSESIYGSQRFFPDHTFHWQGAYTRKDTTVYLHLFRYSAPEIVVPLITPHPVKATILTNGQTVGIRKGHNSGFVITGLPPVPPHPYHTVIKLEFDEKPQRVPEAHRRGDWISGKVTAEKQKL